MRRRTELRGRAARLARLLPTGQSRAAKTPFVLLMVMLLSGGLITLLVLNSSLNEGSFELSRLKKQSTDLTDEQQALQREVNGYADPDALERRARELGMVPGGDPAFLDPDGTVRGIPGEPAPTPPPSPMPPMPSSPASSPSGSAASPSAGVSPTRSTGTAAATLGATAGATTPGAAMPTRAVRLAPPASSVSSTSTSTPTLTR